MTAKLKKIIDAVSRYAETSHPVIIVLILAVLILALITGHKYYQYTKNDPGYCELCHVMKESYTSWEKSAHRNTKCQDCHAMSLLGQNRLFLSYIFSTGIDNASAEHATIAPWKSCTICHLETVKQGSISMRKSYGHARHVFMEKIECNKCHISNMHNFPPDEKNCLDCHEDKGVHGMGTQSFSCLSCHVYGEVTSMPTKQKCLQCHKKIPEKGPMSGIECQSCHKPHSKMKPSANDCMISCHTNQQNIGRHDKHIDIPCLVCHKAHSWKVGLEQAQILCIKCHKFHDPATFVF